MAFDKEDEAGIVYVWIGDKSQDNEAHIAEEIATTYFKPVHLFIFCNNVQINYVEFDLFYLFTYIGQV